MMIIAGCTHQTNYHSALRAHLTLIVTAHLLLLQRHRRRNFMKSDRWMNKLLRCTKHSVIHQGMLSLPLEHAYSPEDERPGASFVSYKDLAQIHIASVSYAAPRVTVRSILADSRVKNIYLSGLALTDHQQRTRLEFEHRDCEMRCGHTHLFTQSETLHTPAIRV